MSTCVKHATAWKSQVELDTAIRSGRNGTITNSKPHWSRRLHGYTHNNFQHNKYDLELRSVRGAIIRIHGGANAHYVICDIWHTSTQCDPLIIMTVCHTAAGRRYKRPGIYRTCGLPIHYMKTSDGVFGLGGKP